MQVRLEVSHNKANVKRVVLRQDAVIGRGKECNLRIASNLVSRQHCRIVLGGEGVFVRDLGSSNGTYLAGMRLPREQDVYLPPGSELSIGGVSFVVQYDPPDGVPGGSTVEIPAVPEQAAAPSPTSADSGKKAPAPAASPVDVPAGGPAADEADPPFPLIDVAPADSGDVPEVVIEDTPAVETSAESKSPGILGRLFGRGGKRKRSASPAAAAPESIGPPPEIPDVVEVPGEVAVFEGLNLDAEPEDAARTVDHADDETVPQLPDVSSAGAQPSVPAAEVPADAQEEAPDDFLRRLAGQ